MTEATTVEAIFQDGVFKPLYPITLPDNTRVEIQVPRSAAGLADEGYLGALAGAFPELTALTEADLGWAKAQLVDCLSHATPV